MQACCDAGRGGGRGRFDTIKPLQSEVGGETPSTSSGLNRFSGPWVGPGGRGHARVCGSSHESATFRGGGRPLLREDGPINYV
jgi:hypothetical protein